jgi:integrase/recombinase XerD
MNLKAYLQQRYTEKTAQVYGQEIERYRASCPGAATAAYKDVLAYVGALRTRYTNASTLNRIVCSIKAYYDYLCDSGQRADHPTRSIVLKDVRSRDIQLQDLFTMAELEALLHRKERYSHLESRNKVLMSLLVYQALYPVEMEALSTGDINLESGTIHINAMAKTHSRKLSLKPSQILLFYTYIREVRPHLLKENTGELLLIGQRGEPMTAEDITRHVKRSFTGLYPGRTVNAQTIRQSVIAELLKQGHDLSVVQAFAGHKYPSTTGRYRQNEVETLKAAVERYHPIRGGAPFESARNPNG